MPCLRHSNSNLQSASAAHISARNVRRLKGNNHATRIRNSYLASASINRAWAFGCVAWLFRRVPDLQLCRTAKKITAAKRRRKQKSGKPKRKWRSQRAASRTTPVFCASKKENAHYSLELDGKNVNKPLTSDEKKAEK